MFYYLVWRPEGSFPYSFNHLLWRRPPPAPVFKAADKASKGSSNKVGRSLECVKDGQSVSDFSTFMDPPFYLGDFLLKNTIPLGSCSFIFWWKPTHLWGWHVRVAPKNGVSRCVEQFPVRASRQPHQHVGHCSNHFKSTQPGYDIHSLPWRKSTIFKW